MMIRGLSVPLALGLAAIAGGADDGPIAPAAPIALFNGRDLSGWYPYLKDSQREDPKKVFSVQNGVLRVAGMPMGYLATEKAYRDYHLSLEYQWGKETHGNKGVRNSGILLNGTGPDRVWMASIECQLAQGCVGDFIVIRGKDAKGEAIPTRFTSETGIGKDKHPRWQKGGKPRVFAGGQQWWSLHQEFFKEELDSRGKQDRESPLGEWTKMDVINTERRITVRVNGTTVNECADVFPPAGKILLQAEGFEIRFRNVELRPAKKG